MDKVPVNRIDWLLLGFVGSLWTAPTASKRREFSAEPTSSARWQVGLRNAGGVCAEPANGADIGKLTRRHPHKGFYMFLPSDGELRNGAKSMLGSQAESMKHQTLD